MGRKIEQSVTDAIRARRAFSGGNTTVSFDGQDVGTVFLHGHKLATMLHGRVELTWAGWHTSTTRSRLNAILRAVAPNWVACIAHGQGRFVNVATREMQPVSELSVPLS